MVLESLEAKENDKILKKNFFQNFGGFWAPQNPQKTLKGTFNSSLHKVARDDSVNCNLYIYT